jgi:hypothetical protein
MFGSKNPSIWIATAIWISSVKFPAGDRVGQVVWIENVNGNDFAAPVRLLTPLSPDQVTPRDLDNDRDVDLLVAFGGTLVVYRNVDGAGRFEPSAPIISGAGALRVFSLPDLDGDGDTDIVAHVGREIVWLENLDGSGSYGAARIIFSSHQFLWREVPIDIDRDGDLDILGVVAGLKENDPYDIVWFENNSGGDGWKFRTIASNPGTTWISDVRDWDDDGDPDFIAGWANGSLVLFDNTDGAGTFVSSQVIVDGTQGSPWVFDVTDLNGDGRFDLAIAMDQQREYAISYAHNTAAGKFDVQRIMTIPADYGTFELHDFDNDGDGDLLAAVEHDLDSRTISSLRWFQNVSNVEIDILGENQQVFPGTHHEYRVAVANPTTTTIENALVEIQFDQPNAVKSTWTCSATGEATCPSNGTGSVQAAVSLPAGSRVEFNISVDLSDTAAGELRLNASVLVDKSRQRAQHTLLVRPREFPLRTYTGLYAPDEESRIDVAGGDGMDLTDVDGDDDLDLLARDSDNVWVLINDGSGEFRPDGIIAQDPRFDYCDCLDFGDLNRDGRSEVVTLNSAEILIHEFDRRTLTMTVRNRYAVEFVPNSIAVADLDGDEHLDIIVGGQREPGQPYEYVVLLNDGFGAFHLSGPNQLMGLPVDLSWANLLTADVDGDGDVDVLASSGKSVLLRNDGRGLFAEPERLQCECYNILALGDLDGDGDPDAVGYFVEIQVFWNDGTGRRFSDGPRLFGEGAYKTQLLDVDADGDLDVLKSSTSFAGSSLWINREAGVFEGGGRIPGYGMLAAGDIDGDQDADLMNSSGGSIEVWRQADADADLRVQMAAAADRLFAGQRVSFDVTVTNDGPAPVSGLQLESIVTGLLDVTWTCMATVASTCTAGTSDVLTGRFSVSPGGNATFKLTGRVMSNVEQLMVMAEITTPHWLFTDRDLGNNRAIFAKGIEPGRVPGDSNNDGVFDSGDLVAVFQAGEYEDAIRGNSTWEEGDWNADGDFDSADLVHAFQAGTFVAAAVASVFVGRAIPTQIMLDGDQVDSSLEHDQSVKTTIYAAAGIPLATVIRKPKLRETRCSRLREGSSVPTF